MPRVHQPAAYDRLLEQLEKLPGIGSRSAQRIAFHLLKQPAQEAADLAQAIGDLTANLKVCSITGHVSESDPCSLAIDPTRDHATILVVEQPTDVFTLEQLGTYRGSYHVLMGRIAPLEAIEPGELNIDKLFDRVQNNPIREVILGLNPTLEGDGTMLYLHQKLANLGVKVSRLARGLPTGSSLASLSKAVLSDAVNGRQTMA